MRQHRYLVCLFGILLFGCTKPETKVLEKTQQEQFLDLYRTTDSGRPPTQEIQRNLFLKAHEKKVESFCDSVLLFNNWKGKITNIGFREVQMGYSEIDLRLEVQIDKLRKIFFFCKFEVGNDERESNHLFNRLKDIQDNSVVYFDGIIKRNRNYEVSYAMENESVIYFFPMINFNLVDISTQPLDRIHSEQLRKRMSMNYKRIGTLRKLQSGLISRDSAMLIPEYVEKEPTTDFSDSLEVDYFVRYLKAVVRGTFDEK